MCTVTCSVIVVVAYRNFESVFVTLHACVIPTGPGQPGNETLLFICLSASGQLHWFGWDWAL